MADILYIVPGSGIIQDTENDAEVIIPGAGIYNERDTAVVAADSVANIINYNGLGRMDFQAGRV